MKIIFAGTPQFAVIALLRLIQSQHEIVAVYTQPDKPVGRGLKLAPTPIKALALQHHLPIYQPLSLKTPEAQHQLKQHDADVMVVAAYGMLLPEVVLSIPRLGCINIHPSLLPRYRGAAPIQRTILGGDEITGVTIMQMDKGLDTGPMLLQENYKVKLGETALSLHDEMAKMGADLLISALDLIERGQIVPKPQPNEGATYAHKITKEEACIDWQKPATELDRMIRAFVQWPVAYTHWQGERVKIGEARVILDDQAQYEDKLPPGAIVTASKEGIEVMTGQGRLVLLKLQLPGGKMLPVADFYHAKHKEWVKGKLFS